ncbi:M61 family metallopeptidase [Lacimicrobium sp. SS2-24]|uniref:M61 family metallopeptidase n=1 Tax=Lacimicrobium sp. SS2-24 TaxID=2005569 RepID=UPI000B4B0257|nr:M61 family metallopeptidase [Lacimicrobium sp. SS2-24]
MSPRLSYQLNLEQADRHLFEVTLRIPVQPQDSLTLSLPAWIPGSYMIRDFAKNLVSLKAFDEKGQSVPITKTEKHSWHLKNTGQAIQVVYQVYAFDTSVRTAYLDNQRAFFNGTSLFLKVSGLENCPHHLCIQAPPDKPAWRVATGLTRAQETKKYGFGDYQAKSYAELIDCPVEIGSFDVHEFDVAGVPHHLVLSGKHYADMPRICADIAAICHHHIRLFEPQTQTPPFSEYWFLTNILPEGFGGLEHRNSTALLCSTFDFLCTNDTKKSDAYIGFLSLVSHEYFHAWNVCRIKPDVFIEPDLSKECYTRQLWAYEGITSYYDDFSLFRCGLIDFSQYLTLLEKTMSRVYRGRGQMKQSVSDSSFDAWTRFYQQGEDAINNIVSYYTKGALIALWLDIHIRMHSDGQKSLDEMMSALWQNYGKQDVGTSDEDFYTLITNLTEPSLAKRLKQLLHEEGVLDLSSELKTMGVEQSVHPVAVKDCLSRAENSTELYLGLLHKPHLQGLEVSAVLEDSPAEAAGIYAKDILLALDHLKLDNQSLISLNNVLVPGSAYRVHLFRQNRLIETTITPSPSPSLAIRLTEKDNAKSQIWKKLTGEKDNTNVC